MNQTNTEPLDLGVQITNLENTEMENGVLTAEQYIELLCLYLRLDRLMDARFLWKRTPASYKLPESLLSKVWRLAVFLFQKQKSRFLSNCQQFLQSETLPQTISSHIFAIYEQIHGELIESIKSTYSCISLECLSNLLSLPRDNIISLMEGWTLTPDGLYLIEPLKDPHQFAKTSDNSKLLSQFLNTLTEFSSFMENA